MYIRRLTRFILLQILSLAGCFVLSGLFSVNAAAVVAPFDQAWNYSENIGSSNPNGVQYDTAYIGSGGNRIGTITSTSDTISLPLSVEVWQRNGSNYWRMGTRNFKLTFNGQTVSFNGDYWYPKRNESGTATVYGSGGRSMGYSNTFIGTALFSVAGLPSGTYEVDISAETELSSPSINNIYTPTTTITYVTIDRPWSTSGETWIGKDDRYTSGGWAGRTINGKKSTSDDQGKSLVTNIHPSERVYWDHYVYNDGPGAMTENSYTAVNIDHADFYTKPRVYYSYPNNNPSKIDSKNVSPIDEYYPPNNYSARPVVFFSSPYQYKAFGGKGIIFDNLYNKQNVDFTVTQDQVGRRICQRVAWFWKGTNDRVWAWTPYACATVPFDYPSPPHEQCTDGVYCHPDPKDCNFYGTCPKPGTSGNYPTDNSVTPSATGNGEVHVGDNVSFTYRVEHNGVGKATKSTTMNYTKYNFVLRGDSGAAQNVSNGELANPEAYSSFGAVNICSGVDGSYRGINHSELRSGTPCNVVSGNIDQMMLGDTKNLDDPSFDKVSLVGNYLKALPGDKICSFVAINRWAAVNDDIAPSVNASPVTCFLITKSPSLQLTGSDAKAGGDFTGSSYSVANTIAGNENRGSYSQLANISNGNISEFGSNNHTTILDKGGVSNLSCKLDFANVTGLTGRCNSSNLSALGRFSNGATGSSSYGPLLPTKPSSTTTLSGNINLNSLSGTKAYSVSGNANIYGTLKTDTHATIYVSGKVTITGPIKYETSTFTQNVEKRAAIYRIPSLTIVSENGNITVNDGVTVVNANLVAANGRVITCAGGSSNSNLGIIGSCNRKLQINGGIVSKGSPKFLRTFGNGNDGSSYDQWYNNSMSASSEWINYTPNVWLTPYTNSHPMSGITDFKTTQIDELPARL